MLKLSESKAYDAVVRQREARAGIRAQSGILIRPMERIVGQYGLEVRSARPA